MSSSFGYSGEQRLIPSIEESPEEVIVRLADEAVRTTDFSRGHFQKIWIKDRSQNREVVPWPEITYIYKGSGQLRNFNVGCNHMDDDTEYYPVLDDDTEYYPVLLDEKYSVVKPYRLSTKRTNQVPRARPANGALVLDNLCFGTPSGRKKHLFTLVIIGVKGASATVVAIRGKCKIVTRPDQLPKELQPVTKGKKRPAGPDTSSSESSEPERKRLSRGPAPTPSIFSPLQEEALRRPHVGRTPSPPMEALWGTGGIMLDGTASKPFRPLAPPAAALDWSGSTSESESESGSPDLEVLAQGDAGFVSGTAQSASLSPAATPAVQRPPAGCPDQPAESEADTAIPLADSFVDYDRNEADLDDLDDPVLTVDDRDDPVFTFDDLWWCLNP